MHVPQIPIDFIDYANVGRPPPAPIKQYVVGGAVEDEDEDEDEEMYREGSNFDAPEGDFVDGDSSLDEIEIANEPVYYGGSNSD